VSAPRAKTRITWVRESASQEVSNPRFGILLMFASTLLRSHRRSPSCAMSHRDASCPGEVPGIHEFQQRRKDVDGRDKPGHDEASKMLEGNETLSAST
jgi:hypothetical protein